MRLRRKAISGLAAVATGIGLSVVAVPSAMGAGNAGYTTFDQTQGGCLDGANGVNCNNYADKADVYMDGGPTGGNGLADGDYYFAVLTPGSQNGGFIDGAAGNLSDTAAGGTAGDFGSGDDVSNRTFTVTDGLISAYGGTHALGTAPDGNTIIQLATYDDTDNAGGVYILAICQVGATSPSQCKYDAFRVPAPGTNPPPPFLTISGEKYYDANTNGKLDPGEVGIANWPINYTDSLSGTAMTDSSGTFTVGDLLPDSYSVSETPGTGSWMQTGNTVDQTSVTGAASASLSSFVYTITSTDTSSVSGLNFGNVCVGALGAGLTLGYWANHVSQIQAGWYAALNALHPVQKSPVGSYITLTKTNISNFLLQAAATNMANMLSAQAVTMELNVLSGKTNASALVYAPGTVSANAAGFATVGALLAEAAAQLLAHPNTVASGPYRTKQEAIKIALDNANNSLTFVEPGPGSCPLPPAPPAT
jgi:hypothetical protein